MNHLESSRKPNEHPSSSSSISGVPLATAAPGPHPSGAGAPLAWHSLKPSLWLCLEFVEPCHRGPWRRGTFRELLVCRPACYGLGQRTWQAFSTLGPDVNLIYGGWSSSVPEFLSFWLCLPLLCSLSCLLLNSSLLPPTPSSLPVPSPPVVSLAFMVTYATYAPVTPMF